MRVTYHMNFHNYVSIRVQFQVRSSSELLMSDFAELQSTWKAMDEKYKIC